MRHYVWALIERLAPLAISFAASIVIARLVGPEAYGLVAMLGIFMALGQAFSELGFGAALVQRREVTSDDETSVFVVNLVAGSLMTAALCGLSPLVAGFFGQPILVPMLCVQSLGILVAATGLVQFARLSRRMDFRMGAMIEVSATAVSGTLGIWMAYAGYGVWSLVALGLCREVARSAAAWMLCGWRPTGRFSMGRVREMWSYCSRLLYSSLAHHVVTNLQSVFIGKLFPPVALGLYSRANSLQALPTGIVVGVVQRVAFPLFSRHQNDPPFLLQTVRRQLRLLVMLVSVMMGLLALSAEELILFLLGPSWVGAAPLLRVLCIAGVFSAAFPLHSQMTMAVGASAVFLRVELLKKLAIVAVLAVVWRFGLVAFAWGAVVVSVSDLLLSAWPNRKLIGYSSRMQLSDVAPCMLLSGAIAAGLSALAWPGAAPLVVTIAAKSLVFGALWFLGLVLFRRSVFAQEWLLLAGGSRAALARVWQG